jgi:hypothetical protein
MLLDLLPASHLLPASQLLDESNIQPTCYNSPLKRALLFEINEESTQ